MSIEKIFRWDFPDTKYDPYSCKEMVLPTMANLNKIVDKLNEVIEEVNRQNNEKDEEDR